MPTRARLDTIENAVRAHVSEENATAVAMASPEQGGDRRGGLPREADQRKHCPNALLLNLVSPIVTRGTARQASRPGMDASQLAGCCDTPERIQPAWGVTGREGTEVREWVISFKTCRLAKAARPCDDE
jgi:hypothetical protein